MKWGEIFPGESRPASHFQGVSLAGSSGASPEKTRGQGETLVGSVKLQEECGTFT